MIKSKELSREIEGVRIINARTWTGTLPQFGILA
jgi:hypothetical protein